MKTVQSLMSIGLGFALAWGILTFFPQRQVSTFKLDPWPVDMDNSNLALIGVGLASPKPKPSVMDASPASSAKPVMLTGQKSPKPVMMTAQSPMPPPMMPPPPLQAN